MKNNKIINFKNLELGKIYAIDYFDNYSTENKTVIAAVNEENLILTTYGKLIGINPKYIIICNNYDKNLETENHDNMHILKTVITKITELQGI